MQASNPQLEMLNDSFSLHPNEGDTHHVVDTVGFQQQDISTDFVVINKDEMLGSGQTTPQLIQELGRGGTEQGRKDTQGSGGDQFNQSFGPENSF